MGERHKERDDEAAADEHAEVGREGVDYGAYADADEAEEHVVLASVPIGHPDEERAAHQADLWIVSNRTILNALEWVMGNGELTWKMAKAMPVLALPFGGSPKYLV